MAIFKLSPQESQVGIGLPRALTPTNHQGPRGPFSCCLFQDDKWGKVFQIPKRPQCDGSRAPARLPNRSGVFACPPADICLTAAIRIPLSSSLLCWFGILFLFSSLLGLLEDLTAREGAAPHGAAITREKEGT